MLDNKRHVNAALALIVLAAVTLACASLKNMGKNPLDEANKLVDSAKDDLDEINKISDEADEKQNELNKADRDKNVSEVKRILGELIEDIDKGTKLGESAADKVDRASKLDVDSTYKQYLSLKAQAFRKEIDAFKALKEAAIIARDNYTAEGLGEKRTDYTNKVNEYKRLKAEAKDLHKKASDVARANPDKIK